MVASRGLPGVVLCAFHPKGRSMRTMRWMIVFGCLLVAGVSLAGQLSPRLEAQFAQKQDDAPGEGPGGPARPRRHPGAGLEPARAARGPGDPPRHRDRDPQGRGARFAGRPAGRPRGAAEPCRGRAVQGPLADQRHHGHRDRAGDPRDRRPRGRRGRRAQPRARADRARVAGRGRGHPQHRHHARRGEHRRAARVERARHPRRGRHHRQQRHRRRRHASRAGQPLARAAARPGSSAGWTCWAPTPSSPATATATAPTAPAP